MVVGQLVEWSLPTPEISGSNPVIVKILSTNCTIKNSKDKNKEKRPGMAHLLKKEVESSASFVLVIISDDWLGDNDVVFPLSRRILIRIRRSSSKSTSLCTSLFYYLQFKIWLLQ